MAAFRPSQVIRSRLQWTGAAEQASGEGIRGGAAVSPAHLAPGAHHACPLYGAGVWPCGRERAQKTQGAELVSGEGVRAFGASSLHISEGHGLQDILLLFSPLEQWQLLGMGQARVAPSSKSSERH